MPTGLLAKNFPVDVQERLKPRIENLPMSFKRIAGWIILIVFCVLYIGLFVYGARDGIMVIAFQTVCGYCPGKSDSCIYMF